MKKSLCTCDSTRRCSRFGPITSSDVSTHLRPGWRSSWGWTFAGTPLSAISRSQLESEVSRSGAAVQSASWRNGSRFRGGTGLQSNNPTSTQNENKKYDNRTFKKFNPVVSHPARPLRLCAFAGGESWTAYRGFMGCHLYQWQSKQPAVWNLPAMA